MTDQPESDSDLRRRAAWLLAMLAVVAVLVVVVLTVLLDSSGGSSDNNGAAPDDTLVTTSTPAAPPTRTSSSPARTTPTTGPGSTTSSAATGTKTCPTSDLCALQGDFGNAVAAINAYRTKNGQPAVPGTVSDAARQCAKNNGSGCSGGWAESQVPALDGDAAVAKVQRLGRLLSPMKSFSVGWAYNPQSKQYFFAVIRQT